MNDALPKSLTIAVEDANEWYRPVFEALRCELRPVDRILSLPDRSEIDRYQSVISDSQIAVGFPPAECLLKSSLRLMMLPSAGYDAYIDRGLGAKAGLAITNAAGVFTPGLAEHALWFMLSGSRQASTFFRQQQQHEWGRKRSGFGELCGSTVCIVGCGNAGNALAIRCAALGMRVIGVRRHASDPPPGVEKMIALRELDQALGEADHVVLFLPGGTETHHLFDADRLSRMKRHAWLYNLGRGSVIEEGAMIDALHNHRLGGIGLDVFEDEPLVSSSPLWDLPNAILTPHVGGFSADDRKRLAELVVHNYRAFFEGNDLRNTVPPALLDPAREARDS